MFQLKFFPETFEHSSLLYISVLKCSILAIILFIIRSKCQGGGGHRWSSGGEKFSGGRFSPCPLLPAPMMLITHHVSNE